MIPSPHQQAGVTGFSLARPVTVLMCFLSVVVLGLYVAGKLPLALLPEGLDYPFLQVVIPYVNSTPLETERRVTIPAEEMLRTVSNIREMRSSSSDSRAAIFMNFNNGTPMDLCYLEVKDRLERLKKDLPEGADKTYIFRFKNTDIPIFYIGVEYDGPLEDAYLPMTNRVTKAFQRVDGVANIDIQGLVQPIVSIDLDVDKLYSLGVPAYELINNLSEDNFNVSGGTIEDGDRKFYIRSIGQFRDLEEIRAIPVKGTNITLGDVAEVEFQHPIQEYLFRINGEYGFGIEIYKESSANTVQVAHEVQVALAKLQKDPALRQFKFHIFFNQAQDILDSLNDLKQSGMIGAILAIVVLWTFLHNLRTTLLVAVSIPCSILATLVYMYFAGMSLNIISMIGMMIATGMLVDNAVVVVENIIRHRQMGSSVREACLEGAREVTLAITAGTMTTVIVFLPLIFSEGIMGRYLAEIGLPISVALLCSLAIAVTVIPLVSTKLVGGKPGSSTPMIALMERSYARSLRWMLHNRITVILLLIGLMAGSFGVAGQKVEFSSDPESDSREMGLNLRMPSYFSLTDSLNVCKELETFFKTHREEFNLEHVAVFFRSTRGHVNLYLERGDKARLTTKQAEGLIRSKLPKFPGVEFRFGWRDESQGAQGVTVNLYGDDSTRLMDYAEEVKRRLKATAGISDVSIDIEDATDEIQLRVDRLSAQKLGLSPFAIASTVSFGIRGRNLRSLKTPDGEIEVWTQFQDDQRATLEDLMELPLGTAMGTVIPLSTVASFERTKGLGSLSRQDGKSVITVKGNADASAVSEIRTKVYASLKDLQLPQGYSWSPSAAMNRMDDDNTDTLRTLLLSTTLVFLLMGALFESLIQPLVIIFTIPLAIPGVLWMLYLSGTPFDTLASVGGVLLVGIVVNNSIVLIDHINQLRHHGLDRESAIVQAGSDRLRPILLTTGTTVLGLIPMAIGAAQAPADDGSLWGTVMGMLHAVIGSTNARFVNFNSLGITVMGGLLSGTIGTLIVIPLIYLFADQLQNAIVRLYTSVLATFRMVTGFARRSQS